MKEKTSFKLLTPIAMMFIMAVGVFHSCKNEIAEVNALNSDTLMPDQTVRAVDMKYSREGLVTLRLRAPLLHQYGGEEPYNEMPEGIDVQTFDDSSKVVTSELTANYAIQFIKSEVMEAKYDVVVVNEKGEQLNTEHLTYDPKKGEIFTDEFVKITTEDQVIMGEGLVSNQDFTDYKILKVSGIINIDDDKVD